MRVKNEMDHAVDRFKALADHTRIAILEHVGRAGGSMTLLELTAELVADERLPFALTKAGVRHHVEVLRDVGMVEISSEREGRQFLIISSDKMFLEAYGPCDERIDTLCNLLEHHKKGAV